MKRLLIVVDMQNDFINGSLGTKEAQTIVKPVAEYIKSFPGDVLFTADTHGENYLDTLEGKNLPVKHCIENTPGWQLAPEINELCIDLGALRYEKHTFGCDLFSNSHKLEELTGMHLPVMADYDEIELCGLCTDICVISNALLIKAFAPETKISVIADLCAGVTPESHDTALAAMKACQITIVNEGKEPWRTINAEQV